MSCTSDSYTRWLTNQPLNRRAVAEIQRNIVKRGKRNAVSRLFHAKDDKEAIATWRLDLNRILHVFNVRSPLCVRSLLIVYLQTELAINTHIVAHEDGICKLYTKIHCY